LAHRYGQCAEGAKALTSSIPLSLRTVIVVIVATIIVVIVVVVATIVVVIVVVRTRWLDTMLNVFALIVIPHLVYTSMSEGKFTFCFHLTKGNMGIVIVIVVVVIIVVIP
jgi:hypothetical protein